MYVRYLASIGVCLAAVGVVNSPLAVGQSGQSSADTRAQIQALEQQFQHEMEVLMQSFQEKLDALNAEHEALKAQVQEGTAQPGAAAAAREPNDFRVFWKDGLRMQTDDKAFEMRLGGRLHIDWGWFDDGDDFRNIFGDVEDGAEFRRARIDLRGTLYSDYSFRMEYDFAGGDAEFKDVYLQASNVPFLYDGHIRVGHFKEPLGLEQLTSDNDTTFMDRSLPNVLTPERNTGVQIGTTFFEMKDVGPQMTATLGVFRETDDFGDGFDDGGYNWTGRLTGVPWYGSESRYVHLGAAASLRNVDGEFQLRERPEAHMARRYVDTGTFFVDDEVRYGLEAAVVYDRLSLQGEYMSTDVDRVRGDSVDFDGWYVQGSVFLTDDHRTYRLSDGYFDKVNPKNNFRFRGKGWGAWELAARYSYLDLTDYPILGGEESNLTIGINWYLNPNIRIMFNYVLADIDRSPLYDDDFQAFQMRFQLAL